MIDNKILKVVKIGGEIINDSNTLIKFLESFAKLTCPKLLVHGGGKLASRLAQQMNVPVKMLKGRRVTDKDTLDIITMVYAGKINKNMIAILQKNKCNAIGFSGADGNTVLAKKREENPVDFGYVGDVVSVDTSSIEMLLLNNITPVFCAISHDGEGQLLNTNADTIASELAIALAEKYEVELYYCFEKKGVLANIEDEDSVIQNIDVKTYKSLKKNDVISDGMLPKMENSFHALEHKVTKVCIGEIYMLFDEKVNRTTLNL